MYNKLYLMNMMIVCVKKLKLMQKMMRMVIIINNDSSNMP